VHGAYREIDAEAAGDCSPIERHRKEGEKIVRFLATVHPVDPRTAPCSSRWRSRHSTVTGCHANIGRAVELKQSRLKKRHIPRTSTASRPSFFELGLPSWGRGLFILSRRRHFRMPEQSRAGAV
jgi:hypothetical protein